MAEFTRTINGHQYRYLSYWDKKAKKSVLMYLGRVNEHGELIIPSGNVPLQKIESTMKLGTMLDMSRKEVWDMILPELQKAHNVRQMRHNPMKKIKQGLEVAKIIILLAALLYAFYNTDRIIEYLDKIINWLLSVI